MKNLKGLASKIAPFLEKENFSHAEIKLLPYFFEQKKISKTSKVLKAKTYQEAINSLIKKGIITENKLHGETVYRLESLETFFAWIRNNASHKVEDIEKGSNTFIDLLRASLGDSVKSKIMLYEGIDGIKDSYRHILDHAENEICAYYSVVEIIQPELQAFFEDEYVPERAKRKIFARNIAPKTPKTTYYKLRSEDSFLELRMVANDIFPLLNSEINLYGKYMHCMVFDEHGGFAVIIEGEDMVKLHKALFEIAWKGCKPLKTDKVEKKKDLNQSTEAFWKHIYVTDNIESVLKRVHQRKEKFIPNLRKKWPIAKAEYITTKSGEHILKICDLEVMSDFQKPYMKELAKIATTHGGKILSVGFGLGIVDGFIEERRKTRKITEHHIIEMNEEVFEHAKKWREKQPNKEKIFLHKGDWESILPKLQKDGTVFDGIIYDAYPLDIDEICRDAVRFLYSLIRLKIVKEKEGIITFFMDSTDGFGNSFQEYLHILGIRDMRVKKIDIKLPDRDHEHWFAPYFLAPLLTDIQYS